MQSPPKCGTWSPRRVALQPRALGCTPPPAFLPRATDPNRGKPWDRISQEIRSNFLAICDAGKSSPQSVTVTPDTSSVSPETNKHPTAELKLSPEQLQQCESQMAKPVIALSYLVSWPKRPSVRPLTSQPLLNTLSRSRHFSQTTSQVMDRSMDRAKIRSPEPEEQDVNHKKSFLNCQHKLLISIKSAHSQI